MSIHAYLAFVSMDDGEIETNNVSSLQVFNTHSTAI